MTAKELLIRLMNDLDFQIADIKCENGIELVGKRCLDGSVIYWPMENEGSGFTDLFWGSIAFAEKYDKFL